MMMMVSIQKSPSSFIATKRINTSITRQLVVVLVVVHFSSLFLSFVSRACYIRSVCIKK